tara:strand:+ start:498 stop:1697 length:1200 start_codon:yes stop_codon:yes gene_type:complete
MKKIINVKVTYLNHPNDNLNLEVNLIGIYAGSQNGGIYNRDNNFEVFNGINDKKYDKDHFINNVSALYRLPNLTLSRDKLANFKDDCGFNVIRNRDKADIVVIGENTLSKMTETTYKDVFDFKHWKSTILNKLIYANLNQEHKSYVIDFINNIANTYGENIYVSPNCDRYYYEDDDTGYVKTVNKFLKIVESTKKAGCHTVSQNHYTNYVKQDSIELYNWIFNNKDNLIKDTVLNKLCVQDSVTITKSEFEQLNNLVGSADGENVNLGLTMMANCNVEESKLYLSLLFAEHSENMKGRKVWNHVNFKYLRKIFEKYININLSSWAGSYDQLIKHLHNDNCLTYWGSRHIAKIMFERVVKSHLGLGTDDTAFTLTVDDLQLKSKYEDKFIPEKELQDLPF